jgi:hypothetical protein
VMPSRRMEMVMPVSLMRRVDREEEEEKERGGGEEKKEKRSHVRMVAPATDQWPAAAFP